MARVKALVSFAGTVTMGNGEIRDIPKGDVLDGLIRAGYVEELDDAPEAKENNPSGGASENSEAPQKKKKGTKK